ncbi:hypothetical protein [Clostridium sp. DL1XJH146]
MYMEMLFIGGAKINGVLKSMVKVDSNVKKTGIEYLSLYSQFFI